MAKRTAAIKRMYCTDGCMDDQPTCVYCETQYCNEEIDMLGWDRDEDIGKLVHPGCRASYEANR